MSCALLTSLYNLEERFSSLQRNVAVHTTPSHTIGAHKLDFITDLLFLNFAQSNVFYSQGTFIISNSEPVYSTHIFVYVEINK